MQQSGEIDGGRRSDWGRTSRDYARHRPEPPESLYRRLAEVGVGLPGQRLLDLGTGTGALARAFAARGLAVAGIDIAEPQIAVAKDLAAEQEVLVDLRVAPAEELPFGNGQFDVATANQCWLYFDLKRAVPELRRVLRPGGLLATSFFSYLPRVSRIARATEELVLRYNPQWSAAGYAGAVAERPSWARGVARQRAMFYYDEPIPFTRDSWRGRMRACRGVGASLPPDAVAALDRDLEALLRSIAPPDFTIPHRIAAHVFELC